MSEDKSEKKIEEKKETKPQQYTYWFFTFNNYTLEEAEQLAEIFKSECKWYIFQEEIGEQGTPHLQGTISLVKRQRLTSLKVFNIKIHWKPTKCVKASIEYCTKEKTRNGKQWIYGINLEIPPTIKLIEPFGWQLELLNIIKQEPDDRTIHWFWEPDGNVGKSQMTKYLVVKHNAIICTGKSADIFHVLTKHKNIALVIVDCPRSQQDFINYGAIEQVKNGLVFSGKYDSTQLVFNSPHVIVFANCRPDLTKMSIDRWNVVDIRSLMGKEIKDDIIEGIE